MSINTTLARPYAKAAFEYAAEEKQLPAWGLFLQRMAFIADDSRVKALLHNPKISTKEKLNFFLDLSGNAADNQKNLLELLSHNQRLTILPEVAKLFDKYTKEYENVMDVKVISAYRLDDQQKKHLQKALEIRLGNKVAMAIYEDKTLIGGVVIHAGDFVIDGSTRGKLQRLRKTLMR